MAQTMKFKNTSDRVVILDAVGLDPVAPGGEVEIPLELAAPGRTDAGSRAKSAIECVAPQLKPSSEADRKLWEATPPAPEPKSKIVTIASRQAQEAPGVKALREAHAKQQAEAKAKEAAAKPATPAQTATK